MTGDRLTRAAHFRPMTSERADQRLEQSRTPFVGRGAELDQIESQFRDGAQLVTLTGAPGAGKTRLAREYGMRRREDLSEVHFFDLSTAESRSEVVGVLADALGVTVDKSDDRPPLEERVLHAIEERSDQLLILDNFEHLADAATGLVSDWLDRTDAQFLVTSRERLGVIGEFCVEIGPLEDADAIELFVARAQMLRPEFELDDELRTTTSELVRRLDGLPLALELAASRIRTLPPAELLERLDRRFELLRSRDPVEDRRDRTLEGAIEWSWELLEPVERETLRQTTVFRGGFSLEAAENVLRIDADTWIADLLESLVRKSLLYSESSDVESGRVRFQLYESIRDYVLRVSESPDGELRSRHGAYYATSARNWRKGLETSEGATSLHHLRTESSNIQAAFEWSREESPERAVELGLSLDRMLRLAGPFSTHRTIVERVCETAAETERPDLQARAHLARGKLELVRGDLSAARTDCERSAKRARRGERPGLRARALFTLGEVAQRRGDLSEARERFREARELARGEGRRALERLALAHLAACCADLDAADRAADYLEQFDATNRGDDLRRECRAVKQAANAHYYLDDFSAQRAANRRAVELARAISDRKLEGLALQGLGTSALALGSYQTAIDRYEEALEIHRRCGNVHYEGVLLGNLGSALHRRSRLPEARERYREALEIHRRTGAEPYEATVRFAMGALHYETGEISEARRLLERGLDVYDSIEGHTEDAAATTWTLAWIALGEREFARARDSFRAAARQFDNTDAPNWKRLSALALGLAERLVSGTVEDGVAPAEASSSVDGDSAKTVRKLESLIAALTDALAGDGDPDQVRATARSPSDEPSLFEQSLYGRVSTLASEKLLDADIAFPSADGDAAPNATVDNADLVVGPGGRWFRRGSGAFDDLRRRGALRRILAELADRHGESPDPLDVYAMFDVGWPDQEIDPDNAKDRVYWAVRELRKAGLDDLLQTTDEGYVLDPDASLARSDRSSPD